MTATRLLALALLTLAAAHGCATVNPRPDYDHAARRIAEATGPFETLSPDDDPLIDKKVRALLDNGLTADEAVQLCLLNNPQVRNAFLSIGIARADVVQAGLYTNPTLALAVRFPDGGGLVNIEAALAQRIADLWLVPLRRRAAQADLDRRILDVAREVSVLALQTRDQYYQAVAADRRLHIAEENSTLAAQLRDAALARQQAGAGGQIDVNLARAGVLDAELAAREAALNAFESRRRLAALLGLSTAPAELRLVDVLPEPTMLNVADDQLISLANTHRLDLQSAQFAVAAAEVRVRQEKRSVFADVEFGLAVERSDRPASSDGGYLGNAARATVDAGTLSLPPPNPSDAGQDVILGPALSLSLPIFDQNQAQIARAELAHRQTLAALHVLQLDIIQTARAALHQARTAADVAALYRDQLIPLLENNLELSGEAYRAGRTAFLSVLEVQRELLKSRTRHVEAQRDAARAVVELEMAVGLPIAEIVSRAAEHPGGSAPEAASDPEQAEEPNHDE